MRTMLTVSIPVAKGNAAIKDGSLPKTMEGFMSEFKPEAAYFYPANGRRTAVMFFDLKEPSQIPVVAERFFMALDAEVTMTTVMNADDLKKGLSSLKMGG